jgi:hypothetical protein
MDWYYPVLAGCMSGEPAKIRLADGWAEFAMEQLGIRCVSDEPWVTASETAECAIAHAAIGDVATASDLVVGHAGTGAATAPITPGPRLPRRDPFPRRRGVGVHRRRSGSWPPMQSTARSPASGVFRAALLH